MVTALIATNRSGQALPPVTARNASQSAEEPPAKRQKVQVRCAEVSHTWVCLHLHHALQCDPSFVQLLTWRLRLFCWHRSSSLTLQTKKPGGALSKMESAAAAAQRKLQAQVEAAEGPPRLPTAEGPRGTLIVCPLSVLSNWQQQILEHTAGNLQVWLHHVIELLHCDFLGAQLSLTPNNVVIP